MISRGSLTAFDIREVALFIDIELYSLLFLDLGTVFILQKEYCMLLVSINM